MSDDAFAAATAAIITAGQRMDRFGWVPATAGNISVRLPDGVVAITRSGGHKGFLDAQGVIRVDLEGRPLRAGDRPSAETGLHCGIYRRFPEAGAVLHGHSVPVTHLSRRSAGDAILLQGYELLKAFPGLPTHAAAIALPVLDNDQDIARLQRAVDARWDMSGTVPPGYLIRGHGIYVWGADMPTALLRLEALEFMLACELEARRAA
ncbi:methylthioribulose 1-phosphate dehydratase [Roseicella aquatilis]|uniref:Methylthioribulose-1-phosphate dehydratase n=1 Tax=Roseicella aquatilis TaxID=2527868 RepID=A0A4R4DUY5_9PROT|nr:methylthioribulose 1-phosphate dehydratase [Roseicella aquatilis]TCZ66107.1 methylthioribulose 1-phosphate dehydratase [Roseicella aquatilis]